MIYELIKPNNCISIKSSNYTSIEVKFDGELKHKFVTSYLSNEIVYIYRLEDYGNYDITSDGTIDEITQYHKLLNTHILRDHAVLRLYLCPTYNGQIEVAGRYNKLNSGKYMLESGSTLTAPSEYFDARLIMGITSISGSLPMDVTVSGLLYNEEFDGYISEVENITVTGTGYYGTYNYYVDKPDINILDANKSFSFDLYKACPWTGGHENFTVQGCRFTWVPDGNEWFINMNVYHCMDSGDLVVIDSVEFRYDDIIKRASFDTKGSYRRQNYDTPIRGCDSEGLVVTVDQSEISCFDLEIRYTLDYVVAGSS